jgi:uncharacterized phiE125 gp8 family phage protein
VKYKVITPPVAPVITLADLREHLRVEEASALQDGLILGWLEAAREYCQHYTQRAIGLQTIEIAIDEFPEASIALLPGPAISITSIKFINQIGVEQTLGNSLYTLDNYGIEHWVLPLSTTDWPVTLDAANVVKIVYKAGDIPAAVRAAMLLIVHDLFERRGEVSEVHLYKAPLSVNHLLDTVKSWSI